jgi:hypothetical protein
VLHVATGTGYVVGTGSGAWFPPVNALALANGTVSAAQPLGFSFSLPNGTPTTDVWVCDDGYLWLNSQGIADFTPAVNELLAQGARLAPCWMSLDASGSVYFDTDPVNNVAYVTWLNSPETGNAASTISMQVALFASGDFEYRYGPETLSTLGNTFGLVGMSPGGGALDPGNRDLSATLPFLTAPDLVTPDLALSSPTRPVLGTTWDLSVDDIPVTTLFGVHIFGTADPGILDLALLGLPGCQLRTSLDVIVGPWLPGGASFAYGLPVPAGPPSLIGLELFTQAATFGNPPTNAFGAITSNGFKGTLGDM